MRRVTAAAALVSAALVSASASAHDHWLAPDKPFVQPGSDVSVRLLFGEHLASEGEHPFEAKKLARLTLVHPRWARELRSLGTEGQKPAIRQKITQPGGYLFVADRATQYLVLEPAKFEAYLEEEGFSEALAERAKRGEQKRSGRERYTRYLKSLVVAGEGGESAYGLVLGQRFEIVPEADPAKLRLGDALPVRVLFEGKPLAGAAVAAYARDELSSADLAAKTDAEGRASFRVARAGTWLVRAVVMRRCEGCVDADWESFWASYAFTVK